MFSIRTTTRVLCAAAFLAAFVAAFGTTQAAEKPKSFVPGGQAAKAPKATSSVNPQVSLGYTEIEWNYLKAPGQKATPTAGKLSSAKTVNPKLSGPTTVRHEYIDTGTTAGIRGGKRRGK